MIIKKLFPQSHQIITALSENLFFSPFYKGLKRTRPFNDEPKFYQYACEIDGLDEDGYGSGISISDKLAKIKAIGETIERQALNDTGTGDLVKKFSEIKEDAADPALWLDIHALKIPDTIDYLRNFNFRWIKARDIIKNSDIYVPAQLVYVPYNFGEEPTLRMPISTGAAFGFSMADSMSRGILEAVERDAFMINYLLKTSSPRVHHEVVDIFKDYFSRYRLNVDVFCIANEFKVPVVLSILRDSTGIGPYLTAGLKADFSVESAIIGSVLESVHVRSWLRFSYAVDGSPSINTPEEIVDLKARGYYWYKNNVNTDLDFLLNSKNASDMSDYEENSIKSLLSYLSERNFNVFNVDITNPEHPGVVTKTLVPEFQPLRLIESKDFFVSKRLSEFRKYDFNNVPHPFT
jgi:thiazole/oxazole-forming peptide maturase SagD family component